MTEKIEEVKEEVEAKAEVEDIVVEKEDKKSNFKETQTDNSEERRQYRDNRKDYRRDNRDNRDNREPREYRGSGDRDDYRFRKMRRKVCLLCKEKDYVLDYKDAETIKRFINEKGKILPRRATGTCAKHQREIANVIKRARHIAVIPYTMD